MFEELRDQIKKAFSKLKVELNDYRDAINENTNEIQANYEYLCRVDSKLEKLTERIDELTLFMNQLAQKSGLTEKQQKTYAVEKLTRKEQEVFMVLYAKENNVPMTDQDIARRIALSVDLVSLYVSNLIIKGVPVIKQMIDGTQQYILDQEFKIYQAKNNIIGISEEIALSVQRN